MYDRPTASELLEAARHHLETQMLPVARSTNFKLYFQTLVAINVMKIAGRELAFADTHFRAEWSRLNMLLGGEALPHTQAEQHQRLRERNAALCQAIRAGEWDESQPLFEHLKARTIEQLEVANPKFLAVLQAEDAAAS